MTFDEQSGKGIVKVIYRTYLQNLFPKLKILLPYIPLQHKTTGVGESVRRLCVTYTNILASKMPVQGLRHPKRQWNIVCVGSPCVGSCVGHFFVFISFALGSQFPVEYGLKGLISNNAALAFHPQVGEIYRPTITKYLNSVSCCTPFSKTLSCIPGRHMAAETAITGIQRKY